MTLQLPKDFDWKFYLDYHKDLKKAGFTTENQAVNHYLKNGYKEKRIYKKSNYTNISNSEVNNEVVQKIEKIILESKDKFNLTKNINNNNKENNFKKNIVFTICANNYLSQSITLGDSLLKFNENYKFIIFSVGKKNKLIDDVNLDYEIIEVKDIGIPNIIEMSKNYNVTEFSTSVKPFCFKYLFDKYESNNITYLDPDILVLSEFTELEKKIEEYDIILTPHILKPYYDDFVPSEKTISNAGIYNLGFISIKNTENSLNFLKWWSYNLQKLCKIDLCNGLFVDQKWIDFVPSYFDKVHILKNIGYNVAYWNLHERNLTKVNDSYYVNKTEKLVFFHFSGYKFDNKISIHTNRFDFEKRKDILDLFLEYTKLVYENGKLFFSKMTYDVSIPKNSDGVNLCGFINGNFGIAKNVKIIKKSLENLNINHNVNELRINSKKFINEFNNTKENNFNTNIISVNPDNILNLIDKNYLTNKYNIGVWFWELEKLPKLWLENSKKYSEIWATSDFMFNIFKENLPSNTEIKRVNFPVDIPKKIDKKVAKKYFGINEDEFLCLFIFDYTSCYYRKNPNGVIKSFKDAFTNNEKCKLIIKSQNAPKEYFEKIKNLVENDDRIILINEMYDSEKINILLNSSDLYISLHRSEGLGLTLMESILLEKPVVCTNYSGNIDFCLPEWSELVDYKLNNIPQNSFYTKLLDGVSAEWAEPNLKDATNKILKIYQNYSEYEEKIKKGREWIIENYNYENFERQIKEILKT